MKKLLCTALGTLLCLSATASVFMKEYETDRFLVIGASKASDLTAETARALAAEGVLATNLATEVDRAVAAEGVLTTNLSTEVDRAVAAEGVLTTNLATEVDRALAAEGVLTTNLSAEIDRAVAAEGVLTTNLTAEIDRATAAEGVLTTNLSVEVDRAVAAEGVLTTNLATEVDRAVAAEGVLTTNLATEVDRAIAAEGVLTTNLATKLDIANIAQTTGTNTYKVISQAAISANWADVQDQIENLGLFALKFYQTTNELSGTAWTPTNQQYFLSHSPDTNATSFEYVYTNAGAYGYVAVDVETDHVFTTNPAGDAAVISYATEEGAGDIFDYIELYAFPTNGSAPTLLGSSSPAQVTVGTLPVARYFTVAYAAHADAGGYYIGNKTRCYSKGAGSTVKQWCGDGYNTSFSLSLPSQILSDLYLEETQLKQTVTDVAEDVPSGAAVTAGLAEKVDNDSGMATNLTVVGSFTLASKAVTNITDTVLDDTNTIPTGAAVTAGLATKVDITNGVSVGTSTLQTAGATSNYVSKVYTGGQLVITEVYNGATNTYYDFTD